MNNKIQAAIDETMSALLAKHPFAASLMYSLTKGIEYDPSVPTAATNGQRILVGDWFCEQSHGERLFVAWHELLHIMNDDLGRAALYRARGFGPDMLVWDEDKWNVACDYVNNALLRQAGIGAMPKEGLYDSQYGPDMLADVCYSKLPSTPPNKKGQHGQPGAGKGFDQHQPAPGPTTPEQDAKRKEAIVSAANTAKMAGNLPGGLARAIGEIIEPKQNWRDILRDWMVLHGGRDEQSWARPRKRSLALPPHVPFPGRSGFSMHSLVLAIDVSGSIGPVELSAFLGCIAGIIEQCKPRSLHVLWWDTNAIHEDITDFDVEDITQLHPSGGGGTNYNCVPPMIEELGLDPDVVVCATDGYVSWPDPSAIRWPHVTVTTGSDAPFGKNIKLEL
jgi:hypothetical protein